MGIFLPLLIIILFFAILLIFIFKIVGLAYSYFFWGAINVPTTEKRVSQMINLLDLSLAKKAVDLGAGDGRLIIALAEKGIEAHGFEINPFLVSEAQKKIKEAGLEERAFMHFKNLWNENLEEFDVVVVYGMWHMMKKLEKKLDKELKPGAIVVSNYFTFPKWPHVKEEDKIYLYIKKSV